MSLDTHRVLRIGVVFKGQILAERVLDRRSDVSVGTRADCTVQISAKDHPSFPDTLKLAVLHKNAYHLLLPADPNVQLNLRGGTGGQIAITAKDVVTVRGKRAVLIESYTGGSIALGDVILMFQFVRGDAVPTVTREETVLRIGLVFESRLLSDRIYNTGNTVSVGPNPSDTLVLDSEDYKGGSASFSFDQAGTATIKLPASSDLRMASDGAPIDEAEAVRKGIARRTADGVELTIGLKSRGRAKLGPYTLLFQVIRRTITVPQMPRATVLGQLAAPLMNDPVWSISFLVSLLLIGSVVTQAVIFQHTTGKYLKQQRLEEMESHDTFEVIVEEKEEPEPEKETVDIKSDEAKKEEQKELKKDPVKKQKPQNTAKKQVDPEERKRNARKVVAKRTIAGAFMDRTGMASKLFAAGGEGDAVVQAKTFGGGAEEQQGPGGGLRLEGGGGAGSIEAVATTRKGFGQRSQAETKVKNKKIEKKITISLSAGGLGGSGKGKEGVAKVIRRKNSAIRRCYEAALRNNPSLSGKVQVQFTVGTAGTITRVNVIGAAGEFASCIESKFTRIRGLPLLTSPQSFNQSYVFTKG